MENQKAETKEIQQIKYTEVTLDIDVFKKQYEEMVIDGESSIQKALSIQKQVKSLKSLAKSTTEFEWNRKKIAYEESRTETDNKKKEYYEIRDKRNALMSACSDIFTGIKKKIEVFQAECVRKAEEGRRVKEEEKQRLEELEEERKRREEKKSKKSQEPKAQEQTHEKEKKCYWNWPDIIPCDPDCESAPWEACKMNKPPQQNESIDNTPGQVVDTTAVSAPEDTQKSEQGQNEPVTEEIDLDFEIYDMYEFLGAIVRGERGAITNLVLTNGDEIMKFAEKLECKAGDNVISGCRVIPFDHGDMVI